MGLFQDLRRAIAGAAVGAGLALGAERLARLRQVVRWLSAVGWAVFAVYVVVMLLVGAGVI